MGNHSKIELKRGGSIVHRKTSGNGQQDIPASVGTCGEAEFRRPREGRFHEQPCGSMLRIRTGADGRGNIGGSIPEEGKDKRRISSDGKVWGIMAAYGFRKRIPDTMVPCSYSSSFCSCSLSFNGMASSSFCWHSMEDRSSHHMFFSSSLKDRNTVGSTRSPSAMSRIIATEICPLYFPVQYGSGRWC